MTELLFLKDSYLKEFDATVTESNPDYALLDKTCFYGRAGGQPGDTGKLVLENGEEVKVIDTIKEKGEIRHYLEKQLPVGTKVHGVIDWEKRYKLMRMHTSQHIVSAIILDEYGAETVGNQIHEDHSRVDFKPFKPTQEDLEKIEEKFNEVVDKKIGLEFKIVSREEMLDKVDEKRRKLFERLPSFIKKIRLVIIKGVDVCPCAGTHVNNTSEVGHIKIISHEGKGKDTTRIKYELVNPI